MIDIGTKVRTAVSAITSEGVTKISIQAYKDSSYKTKVTGLKGAWEGNFNPSSISHDSRVEYFEDVPIGSTGGDPRFQRSLPSEISFSLLFDNFQSQGSSAFGVLMGMMGPAPAPIMKQIKQFKDVVYTLNGTIHQPNYLELSFGDYTFNGKVKNLKVEYQDFKTDGEATRAQVNVVFVSAISESFVKKVNNLNSPDMTHHYMIQEGDTLSKICLEIYGSLRPLIPLARLNNLSTLRNLQVGTRLIIPPLVNSDDNG